MLTWNENCSRYDSIDPHLTGINERVSKYRKSCSWWLGNYVKGARPIGTQTRGPTEGERESLKYPLPRWSEERMNDRKKRKKTRFPDTLYVVPHSCRLHSPKIAKREIKKKV